MYQDSNTDNFLAFLDSFTMTTPEDVAMKLATDFRKRRIEKNLTREEIAKRGKVPLANVARFEQRGLISLKNLIQLAIALDYLAEISNLFSTPKFSTMEELTQIHKNTGKKKAYPPKK
ncbi:MAG: helix-turn-helix domain-containing protein [Muribaculaceae bacterium]|nr:helix-turn-helix domain-containing protein [Muribaculaceae bacterium]MDE6793220.1 helix-turn-helix domain-containing protein [Muribaculaceae bacterium]